ncbi:MAG: DNA cytosine methyltransferase [Nitrospina sp.]|nr:DNA cytosine methyltransferase [Nitrospina sp.]
MKEFYRESEVADILGISKRSLGKFKSDLITANLKKQKNHINYEILKNLQQFQLMEKSCWSKEYKTKPIKNYKSIEIFAGAGGLAIGLDKAGFESILLNDFDKDSCETLSRNRNWHVEHDDVTNLSFKKYKGEVDLLSGGFPCQAFSYAGNKRGFEDTRGTLFFEFARAAKECKPKILVGENVRGLLSHEKGQTLETICNVIEELGYDLVDPRVLKAMFYQVPQKRERLFLVGIRKDLKAKELFKYPDPYHRIMTMRDALKKGELYATNVPKSHGAKYPEHKRKILELVPQGGYWRDLPDKYQREYMGQSYHLGGGKTGMARRLSWNDPSLTLTCAPAQKQTERCHPDQTRPLTVREYARIQTFPDNWEFQGSMSSQYKQIGNAVPVNLGFAMGRSLIRLLNEIS